MLALYCPFGVQGTSSSSQLDKYRHWHDDHCSLVTFADQVIESKNTSFTVTHLVLKIKEVPSKTENGGKNDWTFTMSTFIPTHQRAKVRQRSSLVCSSLQVFSRCNSIFPGVILALLLHGLFSFKYVRYKLDLLPAPTARQSDRHRRARGLAGFSRWRSTDLEKRRSWNCGAPSASAQRSTGSFTCDWEKENVKKAQCWEDMKKDEAVASLASLSMKASANSDVSDIAERKDRDLTFFDCRFVGPKQTSGLHSAS